MLVGKGEAFDDLFSKDAMVEKPTGGMNLIKGPVWMRNGSLLFCEIPANGIHRWTSRSGVKEFIKPGEYKSKEKRESFAWRNGLPPDQNGVLNCGEHENRWIARHEHEAKTIGWP